MYCIHRLCIFSFLHAAYFCSPYNYLLYMYNHFIYILHIYVCLCVYVYITYFFVYYINYGFYVVIYENGVVVDEVLKKQTKKRCCFNIPIND